MKNEHIPELLKFGFTTNHPSERAKQLSSVTGVPGHYRILKYWRVDEGYKWEQFVFNRLSSYRKTGEFLKLSPKSAIDKIEIILTEAGATQDYELHELEQSRRREQDLFDEERRKKLEQAWTKNLSRFEKQSLEEAERRLGYKYSSINDEIESIERESIAIKVQNVFDFIWFFFCFACIMLPMILSNMVMSFFGIESNERWLADILDGGKSSDEIGNLRKKMSKLNIERERLFNIAKNNYFRVSE